MNMRGCKAFAPHDAKIQQARPKLRHRDHRLQCKSSGGPIGGPGQQQDYTRLFQESQNNIMRLNQSRLNALAELKSARQRIADLEKRLGEAQEQIQAVAEQERHTNYSESAYREYEEAEQSYAHPPHQQGHHQQQQQQSITLGYSTGWKQVYIHYRSQSQGWTNVPGVRLQPGSGNFAGHQVAVLPTAERIEFVMNNGDGNWDTPEYGGNSKNYTIEGPGEYFLKSGKVQKLR